MDTTSWLYLSFQHSLCYFISFMPYSLRQCCQFFWVTLPLCFIMFKLSLLFQDSGAAATAVGGSDGGQVYDAYNTLVVSLISTYFILLYQFHAIQFWTKLLTLPLCFILCQLSLSFQDSGAAATAVGGSDGGQANGPRSWERPWSLEEMRKESGNWSLAGDAGVGL